MRPVFDLEITPLTFLYDQKLSPALIVGRGMRRSAVMFAQGDDVEDCGFVHANESAPVPSLTLSFCLAHVTFTMLICGIVVKAYDIRTNFVSPGFDGQVKCSI